MATLSSGEGTSSNSGRGDSLSVQNNRKNSLSYSASHHSHDNDDLCFTSSYVGQVNEKFQTQFSLPKLKKVLDRLTEDQKLIVKDCGFASLLNLKCSYVPKHIAFWLAMNYDSKSKSIKLPGCGAFKIDAFTVHQILGIPYGGRQVTKKANSRVKDLIARDTGTSGNAAKIDDLIDLITPELNGDKFARIFMLIALSVFLCPSSNPHASPAFYSAICVVKDIASYDWSRMVLDWFDVKISFFQASVQKGNTSGVVSLGGCLLFLVASYFDYIDNAEIQIDGRIPRLLVWDDSTIRLFEMVHKKLSCIQLKSIDKTYFDKKYANPTNFRGLCHIYSPVHDSTTIPDDPLEASCAKGVQVGSGNSPTRLHNLSTPPGGHTSGQMGSVHRTIPTHNISSPTGVENSNDNSRGYTDLRNSVHVSHIKSGQVNTESLLTKKFHVLCGDELHPQVDGFIGEILPSSKYEKVKERIRLMCKSFYKTSVSKSLEALEPILVQQSCEIVKVLCAELQDESSTPSTENKCAETDHQASQMDGAQFDRNIMAEPGTSFRQGCLQEIGNKNSLRASSCAHEQCQQQQYCVMRSEVPPRPDNDVPPVVQTKQFDKPLAKSTMHGVNSASISVSSQAQCSDDRRICSISAEVNNSTHVICNLGADFVQNLPSVTNACSQPTNPVDAALHNQGDKASGTCNTCNELARSTSEHYSQKRQMCGIEISTSPLSISPQKKVKISSNNLQKSKDNISAHEADSVQLEPSLDDQGEPNCITGAIVSDMPSHLPCKLTNCHTNECAGDFCDEEGPTVLSSICHKKRALKLPTRLSSPNMTAAFPRSAPAVSKLEKDIFIAATTRVHKEAKSPYIAHIGRCWIDHRTFADSLRPKKWVGSFLMDVYCEALNHDQKDAINPPITKVFLTSLAVRKLKVKHVDLDELMSELSVDRLGISLIEVDMAQNRSKDDTTGRVRAHG